MRDRRRWPLRSGAPGLLGPPQASGARERLQRRPRPSRLWLWRRAVCVSSASVSCGHVPLDADPLAPLRASRPGQHRHAPPTAGIRARPLAWARLVRVRPGGRWRKRGTGGAGRWAAVRKGFGRLSESPTESLSESPATTVAPASASRPRARPVTRAGE